ncbi:hypothetical protein ABMA28_007525 [Loxostege sticticalis]|uniref:Transforming acidic coiled-coil-containing protein C-terminal domain-containing protein n=1 Tax=Loxostege sticticalis TaxID=481309 RepID=A0ABD0SI63_LOXSC
MAHSEEPMDIDNIDSDFDNKENSIHHSNVYPRTPCTEKGYEELDVSELNMKLRYSITPASSPMSKSFTTNSTDNRHESGDDTLNSNLTRSLHSAISRGDVLSKSVKTLPLQTISTEQFVDSNRNASVLRPLDTTTVIDNNVTVTVSGSNDADENMSFPSSSSSTAQTPEATTPTKDIPRNDGGSPIMRGLKSVLNMFRSSQSPIPPAENADGVLKQVLSPTDVTGVTPDSTMQSTPPAVLASTPLAATKHKDSNLSKRSSPLKESLVFNEDLEKELLWKDETTILFSEEKIPIHKLFYQQGAVNMKESAKNNNEKVDTDLNSTVEYMDVSYNDSMIKNRTITELQAEGVHASESDAEFVDCETTFTNDKPDSDVTHPIENVKCEKNLTLTVTGMVSAIDAENSAIMTETPEKVESQTGPEDLLMTELQKSIVTLPLKEETINIPSVSELETKHSILENSKNSMNNVSDIKQEIQDVNTSVNVESDKINETNIISESQTALNATFETTNLPSEALTVDNIGSNPHPDIKINDFQEDVTSESKSPTDTVILSSVSVLAEGIIQITEKSETNDDKVPDSTGLNHELNATLAKEIDVIPVLPDFNKSNEGQVEDATVPNESRVDEPDLPANVPLPDDEDIENEKSIGAVILNEEGINTFSLDINNTNSVGLENVDHVEILPSVSAESNDDNKTINDCILINDFVTTENKTEQFGPIDDGKVRNDNFSVENYTAQEEIKPVETLPIHQPMDTNDSFSDVQVIINDSISDVQVIINDSISDVQVMDVVFTDIENAEENLDITSEQILKAKDNTIQQDGQTILTTQTAVISNENYEINEAKADEIKINAIVTPHVPVAGDCTSIKEETHHLQELLTEVKDNIYINNTAPLADICDSKESHEQPHSVDESQNFQKVLNETAMISYVVQDSNSAKIEEILEKQLSLENNVTAEDTPLPPKDISDISEDSKPEISNVSETTYSKEPIIVDDKAEDVENKDEEIILSENNSPYVSLAGQIDQIPEQLNLEETENPFATRTKVVLTPPSSPKIVSKGYNFNFDEIDDPFATKTKIRMSPSPDTPERPPKEVDTTFPERPPRRDVNKNRRKSQPERKKPAMPQKKMNSTFSGSVNVPKARSNLKPEVIEHIPVTIEPANDTLEDRDIQNQPLHQDKSYDLEPSPPSQIDTINAPVALTENLLEGPTSKELAKEKESEDVRDIDTTMEVNTEENKLLVESLNAISNETKNTSSSEQSTYYSAGTSSSEGTMSGNVFNLPEIDDINFNPFVSKSKIRQSPPSSLNATATLNATQELPSSSDSALELKSDATFTENPFETKSKMRLSPPPNLNASEVLNATQDLALPSGSSSKCDVTFNENPFETKSKMRQSPPPCLNATATLNATQELSGSSDTTSSKLKSDATFIGGTGDFELNKDFETKVFGTFDEKENANVSNTSCSSKATDEKNLTVREVHTEDEDTIEGPFLEAEDLKDDDKMSDFDGEDVDMMQFSELPPQSAEENVDGGELFIDAEAFEFLLNQNKSNVVADSGKESLFLKFDPLFAKKMSSDGVLAALNKKRQSTPKRMAAGVQMDATFDKSIIAGPSTLDTTHEVTNQATNSIAEDSTDDLNVTVSKPMMVVTPAVNPIVTPRNRTATPPSSNRRSITFTSPAIAVIDRLLSLSANNSLVGHDTTVTHMSREQNEADLALTQLRELLAEKEINVYNLRTESKELKDRLSSMESQMRMLESESQDRLKKINDLNEKLSEKTKLNKSMAAVVEEYERTIASLIAETEQDKKRNNEERIRLIKERDEQTAHLASMEVSFSDLHSKYEKSKQIILTCKANEDSYKKSIKEFEENLTKMQSNYELLKQHATSKLNHANQELEKMNRSHEAEVLKLNAMIKRKDLHITSLEETLAQKTKANEELTAICDELINKVG